MSYKKAESNSFAEYQMGQGFGAAVTGNINTTEGVAKLAQKGMNALPAGLQGLSGYEGYPSHLSHYPEFGGEFGEEDDEFDASSVARDSALDGLAGLSNLKGYEAYEGLAGLESNVGPATAGLAGYEGFAGVEDDAFAGYGDSISSLARNSAIDDDDDDDDDDDSSFDGYGGLAGAPEQSFHTFFHKASLARTDMEVIRALAKAVETVSDNASERVKKQYYDLAKEMLIRKKRTSIRHMDLNRVEIESNLGWLINSSLPKTGGFNALLSRSIGKVGSDLARGGKDKLKADQAIAIGRKLARKNVFKGSFGDFNGGSKKTYLGLGVAGVLAVGIAYYLWKNKEEAAAPAKKKKKRSRRRKR
jgi:hypothetical protein